MLGKIEREIAPFWVIARQQYGLTTKDIGVVFEVGVDFALDVVVLRLELVVLCGFSRR